MKVDLTTRYLGLTLSNPVVPSASPLTGDIDHIHQLVEAGAPALVLPSLFEEQIEHDAMAVDSVLEFGGEVSGESPAGFLPQLGLYNTGPETYLELIRRAKLEIDVPVIASLNGTTTGGWTRYARVLADQGIDALELNTYRAITDLAATSDEVERSYLELVETVRDSIELPLAVKIGPSFSSIGHMARRLLDAGADGLVIFNRFYQPDIDLETLAVAPNLVLSDPVELRQVIRWLAILDGLGCDLAATSGVHEAEDAIKAILAGATVVMVASTLLKHGPGRLGEIREGMGQWLEQHGYESVGQGRGSLSYRAIPNPEAFERANYMNALTTYVPSW